MKWLPSGLTRLNVAGLGGDGQQGGRIVTVDNARYVLFSHGGLLDFRAQDDLGFMSPQVFEDVFQALRSDPDIDENELRERYKVIDKDRKTPKFLKDEHKRPYIQFEHGYGPDTRIIQLYESDAKVWRQKKRHTRDESTAGVPPVCVINNHEVEQDEFSLLVAREQFSALKVEHCALLNERKKYNFGSHAHYLKEKLKPTAELLLAKAKLRDPVTPCEENFWDHTSPRRILEANGTHYSIFGNDGSPAFRPIYKNAVQPGGYISPEKFETEILPALEKKYNLDDGDRTVFRKLYSQCDRSRKTPFYGENLDNLATCEFSMGYEEGEVRILARGDGKVFAKPYGQNVHRGYANELPHRPLTEEQFRRCVTEHLKQLDEESGKQLRDFLDQHGFPKLSSGASEGGTGLLERQPGATSAPTRGRWDPDGATLSPIATTRKGGKSKSPL